MPILTLSSTTPSVGGLGAAGTIAHVGTDAKSSFNNGTVVTKQNFTSHNVGDLIIAILGGGGSGGSAVATSVGSAGTTNWQLVVGPGFDATFQGGPAIWMGEVVTVGADTLNVTWDPAHANTTYIAVIQFTATVASGPPIWQIDKTGGPTVGTPGTTITWPSLTPTGTGELYFGTSAEGQNPSAGSTSGFTYATDGSVNEYCYNPSVGTAVAPTCTQASSATWTVLSALIRAFAQTGTLNGNSVTLQQVPAGRQWIVSQIGYEIVPAYVPGTGVAQPTVNVTMNQRALYNGTNGNGGSNQGPPFIAVKPGDNMTVTWINAPVGASCVANFFYTEYDAYVTPNEIGNVV